jgi:hypothetical protein
VDARSGGRNPAGGIIGAEWIDALAIAANCGIDVEWMLRLDPLARQLAVDILEKAVELQLKRDERLANLIIQELVKSMNN